MQMPLTRSQAVTVLLVDDHPLMRKGLRTLLESEDDLTVVGEASNGEEAIEQVRALSPNIVVMDITMPDMNGIEATRRIMADVPDTRVIALSIHSEKRFVEDMLKAGATGYVLKDSVPEELIQAIHTVLHGEAFLSAPILGTVVAGYHESEAALLQTADNEVATALPILQTKLHRPAIPPDLVSRPQLLERLDSGRVQPLTLVAAPSGYGKSVLISSWLALCDWQSAWLSLDKDDNDLRQFLSYFVAAVQSIYPHACEDIQYLARTPQLPTLSTLVSRLSNELDAIDQPFILAIDDYQMIDVQSPVNELLQLLLEHPPIPLHLVMITRRDPALSLTALRARGQLNEVRMHDLRFDTAEVRAMLESTTQFIASNDVLEIMDRQLEGWAVGLRLVSMAMQQSKDPEGLIKHLHGSAQQTLEYIIQEVIAGLQLPLRDWLLKSAILDRFCASLCDAVCMEEGGIEVSGFDGSEFVKAVLGGNLFIIPLDAPGEWFRFHHLFQDYLQRQLSRQLAPAEIAALHSRASTWFERHNLIDEAIKHALEAGDADTAADIIVRHRNEVLNQDRWYVLDAWLEKFPAETVHQRPALLLARVYTAFFAQQFMKMDSILNEVEACLSDDINNDGLRLELKFFKGYLHFWQANIEECQREFETVIKEATQVPQLVIAETELHLGIARAMNGESALAIEALNHRIADIGSSTGPLLSRTIAGLAMIYLLSGSLQLLTFEARRLRNLTGQNRTLLTESWGYYLEGAADLHAMDLDSALDHLSAACEHPYATDARLTIDAMAGMALIHQMMRRTEQAQAILQRLIHFAYETNDPVHISVAHSCEVRIALLRGDVAQASHWAQQYSEPVDPFALFLWLEAPHITRARALVADGSAESLGRASELLGEIRHTTETCHFTCQTIEIAVLQSLLLEKQGHSDTALAALEKAVTMAEAGGWVRPFVELGRPMAELLERLAEHKGSTSFLRRVRETCVAMPARTTGTAAGTRAPGTIGESLSVDPLTRRELDILELLVQRLQNKEIASRLSVSPETVKTHLKHLYQKLDVSNRREAAARATEILESTRPA